MKSTLFTKRLVSISSASICVLAIISGACSLNGSLDSYEGTVTSLLPSKVGSYSQVGQMSPISSDGFVPELRSLIRNAGSVRYRRGDDSAPGKFIFVGVSAFVLFTPDQAKSFMEINKREYLKQGFVIKDETPRNRSSVTGERFLLVPPNNEADRSKEALAYWRNGSVVFIARLSGDSMIEEARRFEESFPY